MPETKVREPAATKAAGVETKRNSGDSPVAANTSSRSDGDSPVAANASPHRDGEGQGGRKRQEEPANRSGRQGGGDGRRGNRQGNSGHGNFQKKGNRKRASQGKSYPQKTKNRGRARSRVTFGGYGEGESEIKVGHLPEFDFLRDQEGMNELAALSSGGGEALDLNPLLTMPLVDLTEYSRGQGIELRMAPARAPLLDEIVKINFEKKIPVTVEGLLEVTEFGYGLIVYQNDNYRVQPQSPFLSEILVKRYGLKRGHILNVQIHPHRESESCPFVLKINSVMGGPPDGIETEPFEDLVPYYPLERILLETSAEATWDNFSMRVVDLLTPVGLGQRGLIVAPPRTGKTVILQGIANSVAENNPEAHLIVLLVDERPEEVTDFQRQVKGEVISSTFDEAAESHVHAAEMVIEKSRRMVEAGRHVILLLDSITRLARAYNTMMPSSGKILSGGVEASALQRPKRFFGSARNIEGGGSLTILATALIETGSRMDEVIFEEFKGTGNMELHLDRALVDKRVFPAINIEQSGTRKEELLYHPDELQKIYSLRRAMKGVPSPEAMEMLIQRVKKTPSNAEFLMGLNR
jgi:transcription termination factor Rho